NWAPSSQWVSPSLLISATMKTATMTATTSGMLNSRSMGVPNRQDTNTSKGATKSAICKLEPTEMPRLRSILLLWPIQNAVECSAALPMTATIMIPTNTSLTPSFVRAASTEPTRNSESNATQAVEMNRTSIDLGSDQAAFFPEASSVSWWDPANS